MSIVARGLALERLELLVGEADVLVLGELVALDEAVRSTTSLHDRAEQLLLDPAPALLVELVERDAAADEVAVNILTGIETRPNDRCPSRWNVVAFGFLLEGLTSDEASTGLCYPQRSDLCIGPRRPDGIEPGPASRRMQDRNSPT